MLTCWIPPEQAHSANCRKKLAAEAVENVQISVLHAYEVQVSELFNSV